FGRGRAAGRAGGGARAQRWTHSVQGGPGLQRAVRGPDRAHDDSGGRCPACLGRELRRQGSGGVPQPGEKAPQPSSTGYSRRDAGPRWRTDRPGPGTRVQCEHRIDRDGNAWPITTGRRAQGEYGPRHVAGDALPAAHRPSAYRARRLTAMALAIPRPRTGPAFRFLVAGLAAAVVVGGSYLAFFGNPLTNSQKTLTYPTSPVATGTLQVTVAATRPVTNGSSGPLTFKSTGKLAELDVTVGE